MAEVRLLIGGRDCDAGGGATFERRDPATGEVATRAAAASVEDAVKAAEASRDAFPSWSITGPNERRALLMRAAELIGERTGDFVAAMGRETGAAANWAGFNCHLAAGMLREAAAMTTRITGEVIPSDRPGCIAMTMREPVGVVLGIAPWNAPVILGVRALAMPLACGNSVILKASEICPHTHRMIGEVFRDAGFPDGVVNVVTNAPQDAAAVVDALIAHPAVRRINFTGSTRVGRIVAETAARHLKPVLLELGGKAPLIVLDDADLDQAVAAAAFGAFMNQGQICMSTERIIVQEGIADAFVERLSAKTATLKAGSPGGDAVLGPVVDQNAADCIRALIDDAVAKGATLHEATEPNGALLSAAFLDHVTADMRIYSEESFGPVAAVLRVADDEEAIRVANDSDYGLSAAIFSRDVTRALAMARRIESGMCHINGPTVHDEAQMPFGGMKGSGHGRFGGEAAISEFTELRWITIDTLPVHYPI